jgi:hypothetical protein
MEWGGFMYNYGCVVGKLRRFVVVVFRALVKAGCEAGEADAKRDSLDVYRR